MKKSLILLSAISIIGFPNVSFSKSGTGLPIPRFVSLRTDEANVRTGPGMQYPKQWVLVKKHIPLEIISEYQDWRKVRDIQGDEGWVHKAMLSGKRTGIVRKNSSKVYKKANISSPQKAVLENGVIAHVELCDKTYCKINVSGVEGYVVSSNLWGVYLGEKVK